MSRGDQQQRAEEGGESRQCGEKRERETCENISLEGPLMLSQLREPLLQTGTLRARNEGVSKA